MERHPYFYIFQKYYLKTRTIRKKDTIKLRYQSFAKHKKITRNFFNKKSRIFCFFCLINILTRILNTDYKDGMKLRDSLKILELFQQSKKMLNMFLRKSQQEQYIHFYPLHLCHSQMQSHLNFLWSNPMDLNQNFYRLQKLFL